MDFRFFLIIESADQLIDAKFFPPFLTLDEPATKSASIFTVCGYTLYIFFASSTLNFLARRNRSYDCKLVAKETESGFEKPTRHNVSSRSV